MIQIREIEYDCAFDAFDATSSQPTSDYAAYFAVRRAVFCEEQEVTVKEEVDGEDGNSRHFALFRGPLAVAVCRLRFVSPLLKLERVACRKEWRGHGYARTLNIEIIRIARKDHPNEVLVAHAQSTVLPFYERLGFVVVSQEFLDEVNILHRTIVFPPRKDRIRSLSIWSAEQHGDHSQFKGDCYDPEVRANMFRLFEAIENLHFIPCVAACVAAVDDDVVTAKLARTLADIALRIQSTAQTQCLPDYQPTTPAERAVQDATDEQFVANIGWEKLNTGHYSQVDEGWRLLYSTLHLALALKEQQRDPKKALLLLDKGLLMGRDTVDGLLAEYAEWMGRRMRKEGEEPAEEKEKMEFSALPNSIRDPSLLTSSTPVDTVEAPLDPIDFLSEYLIPGKPVLVRGAVQEWRACKDWSFDYFLREHGSRTVPVEIGSKYTDDDWSQRLMTVREFFGEALKAEPGRPLYLAQHRLLDQIPSLRRAVEVPELCLAGSSTPEDVDLNFWMGLADTVSPLHTDPRENIFCQVTGSKFVRLISSSQSDAVGAYQEGILTNTSQLDAETMKGVECFDAEVHAGDALFIPRGWWHYVRALTPSISVSCWFDA